MDIKVFSLQEFMDAPFPQGTEVIKGILRKQELQLLVATAKVGKSQMGANLAIQVARGEAFLNQFETVPGRVLVWQTEVAGARMKERLEKMLGVSGCQDIGDRVHIVLERIKLNELQGRAFLNGVIASTKPDLVILDPLYTLHDLDENSSKDMAPFLTALREIMIQNNVACLLVHHQGKRGERSSSRQTGHQSRGSSAIADVPDGTWSLDRNEKTGTANMSFELRNFEAPNSIELVLKDNWWAPTGNEVLTTFHTKNVVAEVTGMPGIKKSDLVKIVTTKFKVSPRTVENRIKSALNQKLLSEKRVGREKVYFIYSETSHPL